MLALDKIKDLKNKQSVNINNMVLDSECRQEINLFRLANISLSIQIQFWQLVQKFKAADVERQAN